MQPPTWLRVHRRDLGVQPLDVFSGRWWRCDRYEIRDGYLRPAGSRFEEYDPFEGAESEARSRGAYRSLFELFPFGFVPDRRGWYITPTPESEKKILEWCSGNGLLGILLAETEEVYLPPRWSTGSEVGLVDRGLGPKRVLNPMQERYVRAGAAWKTRICADLSRLRIESSEETMEGALVSPEDIPATWPKAGVRRVDLQTGNAQVESLSFVWKRFFPDVPDVDRETWSYPPPLSPPFCHIYSERLDAFLSAANRLHEVYTRLSSLRPAPEMTADDVREVTMGVDELAAILSVVRPIPSPADHGYMRRAWVSPSLLTSLGLMMTQDLLAGGRVFKCALRDCDKLMFSFDPKARFCCRTHQDRARKRQAPKSTPPNRGTSKRRVPKE